MLANSGAAFISEILGWVRAKYISEPGFRERPGCSELGLEPPVDHCPAAECGVGRVSSHQAPTPGRLHPWQQTADHSLHPSITLGPDVGVTESEDRHHLRAPPPESPDSRHLREQLVGAQAGPAVAQVTLRPAV